MNRRTVLALLTLPAIAGCTSPLDTSTRLGIIHLVNLSETTEVVDVAVTEDGERVHSSTHMLEPRESRRVDCDWSTDSARFVVESEWAGRTETVDLSEEDVGECAAVDIGVDADYSAHWAYAFECPDDDDWEELLCVPVN